MPVTLEQLKKSTTDKVTQGFISELQAHSALIDAMPFDDCVSPMGGSNLNYVYKRELTPTQAEFRALNTEYTPNEVEFEDVVTQLAILGGAFELDRVTIKATTGSRIINQLDAQFADKRRAIIQGFNNALINGDSGTNANSFDGIGKALVGSEQVITSAVDLSTAQNMEANKMAFADELDAALSALDGQASFILCNAAMKTKLSGLARRLGMYQLTMTDAGARVDNWAGVPFIDLGKNGAKDIIPVEAGKTDLYIVRLGIDGLHGISMDGGDLITTYVPDLNEPGAVKRGEAEMVCGVALKRSKAAAKISGITVSA